MCDPIRSTGLDITTRSCVVDLIFNTKDEHIPACYNTISLGVENGINGHIFICFYA